MAVAIASAVFSSHGRLGTPAAVTAGFEPALWAYAAFAALAAPAAAGIAPSRLETAILAAPADLPAAA